MKTTDRNPNSQDYGQTVRGFEVFFTHPDWKDEKSRFHDKAGKFLKLPAKGCPPYTIDDAIKVMRSYARRGFEVMAQTNSEFGGIEHLTLKEMEEMNLPVE